MLRVWFSGLFALIGSAGLADDGADALLAEFFAARNVEARTEIGARLARNDIDFALLHARLRTGRPYAHDAPTGLLEWSRTGSAGEHETVVLVPDDYEFTNRYRVCFYLHGGVSRPERPERGEDWWRRFDRFDGVEQISVFPSAWRGSPWWHPSQIENLEAVLDRLKTHYNVDENEVFLYGVSDGATGVYYFAMKASTPWAAYFAFIGHPGVLANPSTGVYGEMFETNLVNRPLYIVNGDIDPLYPTTKILPFVEAFREEGATIVFRPQPGGHNTRWWNGESERIVEFMRAHPRDPLPDRVSWEAGDVESFGRFSWVVIDELSGTGRAKGLFPHRRASGRVVVDRRGNSIEVAVDGVERYTLLLAPDEIDFDEPVTVVTNGVVSFEGRVDRSVETLMKWAARDNDRTMLFGAELTIEVE